MTTLAAATRRVLLLAIDAHRHEPDTARWLHDQLRRLDEPLRVAIAGKVKAGKSTLLNALVGEELAPTDAGECTRIVTWYADGRTYSVTAHLRDGSSPADHRHDPLVAVLERLAGLAIDVGTDVLGGPPAALLSD